MERPAPDFRVLHVAAWWPSAGNRSSGLFIQEHIKSLSRQSRGVVLHLRIEKGGPFPWRTVVKHEGGSGMPVITMHISTRIRRFGIWKWLVIKGFQKGVREVRKQLDFNLVHLHVRDKVSQHLVSVPELKELPLVLTEHFSFYHRGLWLKEQDEREKLVTEIRKWFANPSLKKVMPVSQDLAKVLISKFDLDVKKTVVIPNVAHPVFHFREGAAIRGNQVALVGVWNSPKNPLNFLEALKNSGPGFYTGLDIEWVGEGGQMPEVRAYVQQHLPGLRVSFRGYLSKAEISEILSCSAFLIHPTDAENLPTVIIESLCCGTPVLSMNVNGIPELVKDSNGILVPPKDPKALAAAIRWMIENAHTFNRQRIAVEAQKTFSPEAVAGAILQVYSEVVTKGV